MDPAQNTTQHFNHVNKLILSQWPADNVNTCKHL